MQDIEILNQMYILDLELKAKECLNHTQRATKTHVSKKVKKFDKKKMVKIINTLFINNNDNKNKNINQIKDSDDDLENDYHPDEAMLVRETNERRFGLKPDDACLNQKNKS